jgi:hypothetical protein
MLPEKKPVTLEKLGITRDQSSQRKELADPGFTTLPDIFPSPETKDLFCCTACCTSFAAVSAARHFHYSTPKLNAHTSRV